MSSTAISPLPSKTRLASIQRHGDRFEIKETAIPVPGKGEVLVKIRASGVCHTDVHAVDGDWPVKRYTILFFRNTFTRLNLNYRWFPDTRGLVMLFS